MMAKKMLKLIPAVLTCCVVGLAGAAQPAPAAKADAAKAAAAKKGDDAKAKAEDRAVANYKKNKGMMAKK